MGTRKFSGRGGRRISWQFVVAAISIFDGRSDRDNLEHFVERSTMRRLYIFGFIYAVVATVVYPPTANAQIIISNAPIAENEILAKVPLHAFRKIPDDAIASVGGSDTSWILVTSAFVASTSPKSGVESNAQRANLEKALAELRNQAKQSDQGGQGLPATNIAPILARYKESSFQPAQTIDAVAIHQMFQQGVASYDLPASTVETVALGVPIDADFAKTTKTAYDLVDLTTSHNWTPKSAAQIANASKIAASDTRVASATLVNLGDVTFGKPLVFPASEKKLKIEPSLAKAYDVYWIEFALSAGDDAVANVSDLFFAVTLQLPSAIALELVPLRYGMEITHRSTLKTPEVAVEADGNKISVGEFYEQSIEYQELKPTILATGLHEAAFGWTLKDEIVDSSSKRLIAIVGVPKKISSLAVVMHVSATLRPTMSSLFQSSKATTSPQVAVLDLSK